MNDIEIRQKIESGELTVWEARKRLQAAIDDELSKPDESVDLAFVNACEAFLSELEKTDSHYTENLREIRKKIRKKRAPYWGKAAVCAAAVMLAAVVMMPNGITAVLGLKGNDHTSRLEELQGNPQENGVLMDAADICIPLEKETLTLAQAEKTEKIFGGLRLAAQTYADVDGVGCLYRMMVLLENTTDGEMTLSKGSFQGMDADGNRLETSYSIPENIVIPAGEKTFLSVQIEPETMDDAEHFELLLSVQQTHSAVTQKAEAELRDHYFVATLTEDDADGKEANGYLTAWAVDENGTLLDGFHASLQQGEQLLAGESWIFEKRIGSWVTLEQEDTAETDAVGYRLISSEI